jgi:hypothetical protein
MAWTHSRPFFSESTATLMALLAWWALLRAGRGRLAPWALFAGLAAGLVALVHIKAVTLYVGLVPMLLGLVYGGSSPNGK